ncbi:MAG: bifunctional glutamate N-acetyltransferase/amino-acid acetyltransferase ArgJ, partial [Desulfobacterales bacterium]|nr:bifunctional glutamate N-acetyltransferase/amino-acid acetyltransferase ArgJ [Desulfobacterales bacterium]
KNYSSGFKAAGIASGLKKNGGKDLGMIFSEVPASVAGIFTTNKVQASSVILARKRIQSGTCQAIIVNSGNANCCTGSKGMQDTLSMSGFASAELEIPDEHVLVASTGVIGEPIPLDKIKSAVPDLIRELKPDGIADLAESIMTTDTVPKVVTATGKIGGKSYAVTGVAKGSGMIRPNMATMLCFVWTDIKISPAVLQEALLASADKSFNRITIDGDTSTNDMAIIMANGLSDAVVNDTSQVESFRAVLDDVLIKLARMIVKDGEGATKMVEITVKGAESDADAIKVAETVAHSNLVKTAFFGEDANWGRIIAATGRAGVPVLPDSIDIFFDDVQMVKDSMGCGKAVEAETTRVLKKPEFG